MIGDEFAAIVLQEPAHAVRLEVVIHEPRRGILRAGDHLLRAKQLREIPRAHQTPACHSAAIEQKPQPLGHVRGGRECRARGRDVVDALEGCRKHPHRVAHDAVRRGHVGDGCRLQLAGVRVALGHAERAIDTAAHQCLPRRPRGARGDVARERVGHVVVLKPRAETRRGRHKPQTARHRREVEPARAPQVVGIAEADAVGEQIAHRDLARYVRIGELDLRFVLLHRVVECQAAGVGEHRHEHRGERFGRGHVAEACVHRHGVGFAKLADAVALDEDDGVVLDDDDGEAGDAPVGDGFGDVGIETVQGLGLLREDQKEWEQVHGDQRWFAEGRLVRRLPR